MAKRKEEKTQKQEAAPVCEEAQQTCTDQEQACNDEAEAESKEPCAEELLQQLDAVKSELETVKSKSDEYLAIAQRTQADFDNFRRRNAAAKQESRIDGICEAAEAIIPVLDNLERAVMTIEDGPVKTGIDMVIKQFVAALAEIQVEEIETEGKPFDPAVHNAVMQEPATDPEQVDKVAMVLQKGYKRGDRIIRCSMVKVYQ